jgi:glutamate-1-semialdehyde 2,1-aminomutase
VEQWLLSVQHDVDDVDRFAANFARFSATLSRFIPAAVPR